MRPCRRSGQVFADKKSGRDADGPELKTCLAYLRSDDTLVAACPDRFSRSLTDLITLVDGLLRAGVGFRSLHEALATTIPGGRLVLHVFAASAEFIRELIVEGTREGSEVTRASGEHLGRAPARSDQVDPVQAPAGTRAQLRRWLWQGRSVY
ncbi:recombinase family protein (plasmid) [Nocardiopsis flavescens]|nr:recombinase family protein [Nocardiopsis flavescens]